VKRSKLVAAGVGAALGAFALAGPLQHVGVLPQTELGDASKSMIKAALNLSAKPAYGRCDNGWGNGENASPGKSFFSNVGSKFEDPGTGSSPSRSPRSGDGNR